mgnify:CR=1 FL=1
MCDTSDCFSAFNMCAGSAGPYGAVRMLPESELLLKSENLVLHSLKVTVIGLFHLDISVLIFFFPFIHIHIAAPAEMSQTSSPLVS